MSEELVIRHCAPTLAGLKTGSIFCCDFSTELELCSALRRWNRMLAEKGIRVVPLRYRKGRALVYLFRPLGLSRDLECPEARALLLSCGYTGVGVNAALRTLMERLREWDEFPHEIGLFLGYPPEDVWGFMENRARGYKCAGCWKVYGDAEQARKTFAKYKKCTAVYSRMFAQGRSVQRLAVAVKS